MLVLILSSLRGHNLNHKSCFEILQAMDDRRLCVVEASYHTAQWKYDESMTTPLNTLYCNAAISHCIYKS